MTAHMGVVSGSDAFHLRSVRVCVPVFTGYPRILRGPPTRTARTLKDLPFARTPECLSRCASARRLGWLRREDTPLRWSNRP